MKQVAQKAATDFRGNLKKVKSGVFKLEEEEKEQ
jgi:hypothetical protein